MLLIGRMFIAVSCFDLYMHCFPKLSKSIHVCRSYSKTKQWHFCRTFVKCIC